MLSGRARAAACPTPLSATTSLTVEGLLSRRRNRRAADRKLFPDLDLRIHCIPGMLCAPTARLSHDVCCLADGVPVLLLVAEIDVAARAAGRQVPLGAGRRDGRRA